MSKYPTNIDIMKDHLKTANTIFARMVEWFCVVDSNIYESKSKIQEYLHSDPKITYVRYSKEFKDHFTLNILIYDDYRYNDKPVIRYNTTDKTLNVLYNIEYFNTTDLYPFKKIDKRTADKLFSSNEYDNKWIEFIRKYMSIEEYRAKVLTAFMRFINSYYVTPELNREFDLTKESDKFYVSNINSLIVAYNKIISMNTKPGLAEVYFSILAMEKEAKNRDNIFYLRSEKKYILYKTLYYMRKHIFDEDIFIFNVKDKDGKSIDTKSNNKYICYIDEEMIYAHIVNNENILLFSGFDT